MKLDKHDNGRQKCTFCGRFIPKDIDRLSFSYSGPNGRTGYNRVCGLCIIELSKEVDKKPLKEWKRKIALEEL
jgi:hypothetical protein